MAGSLNKVLLIGNLARDVEIRNTQAGEKIANMTVATNETWRDKASGERKERAEFHRVVIFNPNLSDIAERYLRKGSKVYIEGQLQTRRWTDKDGADRYTTEIVLGRFNGTLVMLDGRDASDDRSGDDRQRGGGRQQQSHPDLDDSVPF